MKMDRNLTTDGSGKYALINLRRLRETRDPAWRAAMNSAIEKLDEFGLIDWGNKGESDEFFVIKLKDRYAEPSLMAYANAAVDADEEWAKQVMALAYVAKNHPDKKTPD